MTVAAVVLAASPELALASVDGLPAVRRLADLAWSGGALPIVVVAADSEDVIAHALSGAPVTLAAPDPGDGGPAASVRRGFAVARSEISETDALLLWPVEHVWVGPETVTSLIEAHGVAPAALVVPTWDGAPGWPVLLPAAAVDALANLPPARDPAGLVAGLGAAGFGAWPVDLGDPGSVLDSRTPRGHLPAYEGPVAPVSGVAREWGAAVADEPEDAPLAGPALAPWPQAADEEP